MVTRIRIAGVDAPERAGRCARERQAAEAAASALAGMIEGRCLTLTGVHGDKYFGRVVARVSTESGGDVAEALIAEGHGRAYMGGRRGGWC
ncbi:thermonuclease family protein [Chelatococcus sambhunathii]|uniref:Thermonuclease family protein n=1 Tax=Chelatococcus sambhunathii TaxID=363953 RepID=A0ABU1DJH3_9HYPH|nr:thermonuclease family protein [Chelatococcus sambhunathii]MDR4308030.1 thermonuclease family protein [Chelatococcus sambhunathii]